MVGLTAESLEGLGWPICVTTQTDTPLRALTQTGSGAQRGCRRLDPSEARAGSHLAARAPASQPDRSAGGGPSSTVDALAVLELGLEVVGVHQRDHVDADRLRAGRLALAVVGARTEVRLHRVDHGLGPGVALGLALGQQV